MISYLFLPRACDACSAVAQRCVFAGLFFWFIYNSLYIRLKLAGSYHILTKCPDAQRRTALIFVTQDVGCDSFMCGLGLFRQGGGGIKG